VTESTVSLRTADGLSLEVRRWREDPVPHQWTFVVVHGLGEHSGRYQHLASWFTPLGATVYAMDQRGHGRSGGKRGHAPGLNALLDDIDMVVVRARAEDGGPVVLIGHSFGGLLAIAYALNHADHLDRAVFSAPLLLVKQKVPAWKRALSTVLPKVAPGMSFSNEVDANLLSHDPGIARAYTKDPLVHDRITAGLYGDTIARGEEFITRASNLRTVSPDARPRRPDRGSPWQSAVLCPRGGARSCVLPLPRSLPRDLQRDRPREGLSGHRELVDPAHERAPDRLESAALTV